MHASFSPDVYPVTFHVHVGKAVPEILEYCIDRGLTVLDLLPDQNTNTLGWFACIEGTTQGHFYFESLDDIATITHEAFHATFWCMKKMGSKLTPSSEEPWAYLIQYIVREILKLKDPQQSPGA